MADKNMVTRCLKIIARCSDSVNSAVHLSVIRAVLTIATSEHFVAHGEALVECLKLVFNMAIATEDRVVAMAAQNALLQVRTFNSMIDVTVHLSCKPSDTLALPGVSANAWMICQGLCID